MWARWLSSRCTRRFSAMIWRSFKTVVYCVGLRWAMASWTSRTVLAPRSHSTVKISSSASVGRGGSGWLVGIYEDFTTKPFVVSTILLNGERHFVADGAVRETNHQAN